MAESKGEVQPERLVSLDAYRGFVMLLMASNAFGIARVAREYPDSPVWRFLGYQFDHVAWTGCAFWDLIQPSFMFIVGVAMPYSFAVRADRGDSAARQWGHVLWRAFFLVMLGVFLRSNGSDFTRFTFEDVVSQIGLGYAFVYLTLGKGIKVQAIAAAGILIGYWLLFALWPTVPPDFDAAAMGIPADWRQFEGFAAHWNKHVNPAGWFDRWFLNLFYWPTIFTHNGGGYQTLNFIPSMGTMLFGVITGEYLRTQGDLMTKVRRLAGFGLAAMAFGFVVDGHIWPFVDWNWSIAPIVKKIWTPSWAVFSTGWTLLMLAAFVYIIDVRKWRAWSFPFVVVGMNSLAMYIMAQLMKGWVGRTLQTHFGMDLFEGVYGPMLRETAILFVLWLIVYYMYRKRFFVRV